MCQAREHPAAVVIAGPMGSPPPTCSFLFLVQNSCLTIIFLYIQKAKSLKNRARHSSVYNLSKPREEVEQ